MKKSRFDLPQNHLLIARGLALGHSQKQIGQTIGASQPSISRLLKNGNIRKMALRQKRRLVRRCDDAVGRLLSIINDDTYFEKKDDQYTSVGVQACHTVLQLCYILEQSGKGEYVSQIKEQALDRIVKLILRNR